MKRILSGVIITIILANNCVMAQMTTPVRVKAGEDLYIKLAKEIYGYPSFKKGIVFFKDGKTNEADLNYNLLVGEIQFLATTGDTLSLANELTIKYVTVGADSFYYDEGYVQLIAGNESVKIGRMERIKVVDQQKIGAYDQPSSAGSISTYSSISNDLRTYKLDIRKDVILAKRVYYYFGDKYNSFSKANKKNLFKTYSKKEKELTVFLKENDIDFNKLPDLMKIAEFLKGY